MVQVTINPLVDSNIEDNAAKREYMASSKLWGAMLMIVRETTKEWKETHR